MKGGSRRFLGTTTTFLSPSGSSPPSSSNNGSTNDHLDTKTLLLVVYVVAIIYRHLHLFWARRVEQRRRRALPELARTRVFELLPKTTHRGGGGGKDGKLSSATTDEFEEGEEIRVFPECGHGFHAECVDLWLVCHLSCPLCRRVLTWRRPTSSCCSSCFNC